VALLGTAMHRTVAEKAVTTAISCFQLEGPSRISLVCAVHPAILDSNPKKAIRMSAQLAPASSFARLRTSLR